MTRSDVKVGDKVRVVNPTKTGGYYKKGDVLTVSDRCQWGIAVKESSTPLLHWEYELYEPIKVGDTVTLIDKFYEHEVFKSDIRRTRKQIASLKDAKFIVKDIYGHTNRAATGKIDYTIPVELLEKVEEFPKVPKMGEPATSFKPGKKYVYSKELNERDTGPSTVGFSWHDMCDGKEVDVMSGSRGSIGRCIIHPQWCYEISTIHRHTPEQVAEAQRIIGEIVAGFKFGQCYYIRDESDRELTIRYTAEIADGMHTITAHCSPHDEFNRTIGLLVALCKATGRKLPDWV